MRLLLVLDHKFLLRSDGTVWAHTMFGPSFFARYLAVFSEVRVVARLKPCSEIPLGAQRVDGGRVSFAETCYFEGAAQFLRQRLRLSRILREELLTESAVILRLVQSLPALMAALCREKGIPFGAEIVGDPWDTFSSGAIIHPLRPVIRRYLAWQLRRLCREAAATSYVTEYALQRRYPPAPHRFSTHASSIELYSVASTSRSTSSFSNANRLIYVGGLNHLYKGQDTLLHAVAAVHRRNVPVELIMIGDGKYRGDLVRLARQLGIEQCVHFRGAVPAGPAVFREMDQSDLFVLPSRQEGLPRAAIEAMSRGLPVVLTAVGGNSELVPADELLPVNDIEALAHAIVRKLADRALLAAESARNLTRSREYLDSAIAPRRTAFYQEVLRQRQSNR